jgi:hypothetical protein
MYNLKITELLRKSQVTYARMARSPRTVQVYRVQVFAVLYSIPTERFGDPGSSDNVRSGGGVGWDSEEGLGGRVRRGQVGE